MNILKPAGLLEPTKGVYSQFVVGLMQKQLEETIGRPMHEILIAYAEVGADLPALEAFELFCFFYSNLLQQLP